MVPCWLQISADIFLQHILPEIITDRQQLLKMQNQNACSPPAPPLLFQPDINSKEEALALQLSNLQIEFLICSFQAYLKGKYSYVS